jgi:hypothetical protein
VLVQVKNKSERSLPVRPPGVEKISRLRSRDPVASGVKSRLMYFPCFIKSNPREVSARRCFGFVVIPGLKEIANMER